MNDPRVVESVTNVPRVLLERIKSLCEYWFVSGQQQHMSATEYKTWHALGFGSRTFSELYAILASPAPADHVEDVRAMVAAPSPAGVDGCKCSMPISMLGDGCRRCQPQEHIDRLGEMLDEERGELSDATAIIDGLRGENERIRLNIAEYNEAIACYQSERDQQAQRIGELEGLLRSCLPALSDGGCAALANRIDAALSAGKEGE